MGNIYVQFEGMIYQQIVGIPMGTNCAPFIADWFSFCYERDFMSDLHKSKQYVLIDRFNDTSWCLDDIYTIDNLEFEKHISDILISHGTSVEQSKYFRQRNFFPWFKYKSYWQWCSYQFLRQTRSLQISYRQLPWLSGDDPRLPLYGIYISHLVRFVKYCTSVSDFYSKNLQITSKLLTQGYRYHKLQKHYESSSGHTLTCCLNLVKYPFRHLVPPLVCRVRECPPWCSIVGATVTVHQFFYIWYVTKGISQPVF